MNRSYNFVSYNPVKVIVDRHFFKFDNSFITLHNFALRMYNLYYPGLSFISILPTRVGIFSQNDDTQTHQIRQFLKYSLQLL